MRAFPNQSGSAMTRLIVVVAVVAVMGVVIFQMHSTNEAQRRELAALRATAQEVETLRAEAQELPALREMARGMEALKKEAEDVSRLRGEVSRLRAEQQQFVKAQAEVQRLQGALQQQQAVAQQLRAQQAQSQAQVQAAPMVAQTGAQNPVELQAAQARSFQSACINNLRQIDGAKATWALENRKTGSAVPVDADLFGVDRYIRVKPICPANGTYIISTVDSKPTCTIPGHAF